MALQAQTIVTRACAIANVPGWTSQGGQYLNAVLQELCQTYDLELARKTFNFNFVSTLITPVGNLNTVAGSGPYALPSDYLRAKKGDVMWFNLGVPYPLIPIDIDEFDTMIQQAGFQSYPYLFAVDLGQSPPAAYVWPPSSGSFPVMVRYYSQMPDITTPETSTAIPWFPLDTYLITRVAGELCREADDERWEAMLGDSPNGASGILRRYLAMKDDNDNRAKRVTLDARRFRGPFRGLPNTKIIGW